VNGHRNYQVINLSQPGSGPSAETPATSKKLITAEVSKWEGPVNVDQMITSLVDKAFDNSAEGKKLDKQLKHLSSPSQKAISVAKDSLNYSFSYQGFDPSARAGKLILDEDCKARNRSWAEYERQKYVDKIHVQVVSSMMQIAEAFGMADSAQST